MDIFSERIVVTGGDGFLGRHLCRQLTERGCDPSLVMVPHQADYDLTRENAVIRMYNDFRPNVVIHLAAVVGGIGANRKFPGTFFYKNLTMGAMLMEYARLNDVGKFVAIGTICAYPKFSPVPFKEADLWEGYPEETNAPYGLAKKMLLVQGQSYRQEFGFRSVYLLPVNLYGPGDNFHPEYSHVIPALILKCIEAQARGDDRIEVWGTGQATREFLYVEDAARGIIMATERYDSPEPCNLGAGFEITIADLAELICELTGFEGRIEWDPSQPDGQPRRCLDTTRARDKFDFQAEVSLREGLKRTIDWYRSVDKNSEVQS